MFGRLTQLNQAVDKEFIDSDELLFLYESGHRLKRKRPKVFLFETNGARLWIFKTGQDVEKETVLTRKVEETNENESTGTMVLKYQR